MIYHCCDKNRRAAVDAHATLNGIDWLEVLDLDVLGLDSPRQQTLLVRLLKPVPPGLDDRHVRIEGGERIRRVDAVWAAVADGPPPDSTVDEQALFATLDEPNHVLVVRTDSTGDYSTYRLRLVQDESSDEPFIGFDPRLSSIEFSFKVECPSDFDCRKTPSCRSDPRPPPDIHYLARDYSSLRRLVTDRLSRQMPGWRDRSPADLATTLAELVAYVGDLQHYQLDGIASEAYLHTARRRSSLRRHALLVDYPMHDGCNARAWLHVEVDSGPHTLAEGATFYTRVPGLPDRIVPDSADERTARQAGAEAFEAIETVTLRPAHNSFSFYTWGDTRCCLPVGATQATLRGHWPDLAPGDVLIFQERLGPLSGAEEDADPAHRHAVRLTAVRAFGPAEGGDAEAAPLTDPLPPDPADPASLTEITEIHWHAQDALPFPLCLSSELDEAHGGALVDEVSIALGNIVLADHGRRIVDEALGVVPPPRLHYPPQTDNACRREAPEPLPPRFRPRLVEGPVTQQGTVRVARTVDGLQTSERVLFDADAPASAAFRWHTADAVPFVQLTSTLGSDSQPWSARRDLLSSNATDPYFVVETEDDGSAQVRFGDDRHGQRPDSGTAFSAVYRVGNGPRGNVGADTIVHAVTGEGVIRRVTNPLPARGGAAPEAVAQVRRRAPYAFRTQERAVTPADYAEVTERLDGVQRAAASLRWTGSWHTVFVTVDRAGGEPVDADFTDQVVTHLDRYRMAGHDLNVNDPRHVSLEIDMLVCVDPRHFRADVHNGLLDTLSSGTRRDGTRGLFHPDNFSFGQTVYLSALYAAARTVPGVASVQVTRFQRQGQDDPKPLADGYLQLGRLEIARLDNDPNFPEHGVLRFDLHGGK